MRSLSIKQQSDSNIYTTVFPSPVAGCQTVNTTLRLCSWSFELLQFLAGGEKGRKETSWCSYSCFQLPVMQQADIHGCALYPSELVWRPLPPSSFNGKWLKDGTGWGTHCLLCLKCRIAFKGSGFFHLCPVALKFDFLFAPSYFALIHLSAQQKLSAAELCCSSLRAIRENLSMHNMMVTPVCAGHGLTFGLLDWPAELSFSFGCGV